MTEEDSGRNRKTSLTTTTRMSSEEELDADEVVSGVLKGGKNNEGERTSLQSPKPVSPPVPSFITQTDEHGNPINRRNAHGEVVDEDDPPPNVPDDVKDVDPGVGRCCSCLLRYLLCTNPRDLVSEEAEDFLLPEQKPKHKGKPCLALDLDETLVHSSFVQIPEADFVINLEMENQIFKIYVVKRPGVEEFLAEMSKHYELVLFTASIAAYACKVTEIIDPNGYLDTLLFREHCTFTNGNFVKDLKRLNRGLKRCLIIDNSAISFQFQPQNGICCTSFTTNKADRELIYIRDLLLDIKDSPDLRKNLASIRYHDHIEERYHQDAESGVDPLVEFVKANEVKSESDP